MDNSNKCTIIKKSEYIELKELSNRTKYLEDELNKTKIKLKSAEDKLKQISENDITITFKYCIEEKTLDTSYCYRTTCKTIKESLLGSLILSIKDSNISFSNKITNTLVKIKNHVEYNIKHWLEEQIVDYKLDQIDKTNWKQKYTRLKKLVDEHDSLCFFNSSKILNKQ